MQDLYCGATTIPTALGRGDWYMKEIVDAHEALHISNFTRLYTDAYNARVTTLDTLSDPSEAGVMAKVSQARGPWEMARNDAERREEQHIAPDPFYAVQLAAAQPMLDAIERRIAGECGPPDLRGAWSGVLIEGSDREPVRVNVVQDRTNISGTLETAVFRGTLVGSLAGTTLSITATVPRGGVVGEPNCTIQTQVLARNVTSTAIVGDYSGNHSCSGPFTGRLELRR